MLQLNNIRSDYKIINTPSKLSLSFVIMKPKMHIVERLETQKTTKRNI